MNLLQLKGTTAAFFVQAILSFVISMTAVAVGIVFLPAPLWVRGFLALGTLYVTTSTFTLAKCVRDRQEAAALPRPGQAGSPLPPNAPYVESASGSWG
ncbi:YiaA/YiaB family inner membrane protein [Spirillospora sp. NPDC049652]